MNRRVVLYAAGAVASAALVSSVVLLWKTGAQLGAVVLAAVAPSLLLGFIGLASRYLCRAMPLRGTAVTQLIATHGGSAAAASALWTVAWVASSTALKQPLPDPMPLFALGVILYIGTVIVHYLVLEVEASREAEAAALRYQVLAREAELRAFKSQVDPHFLFNSLNAVASLCGSRPNDAREMAQRLAEFFRLMLRIGALERITLGEEIDLVTRYLAIEKVRFGDRLKTHINVDDAAANCMVPPLLLQPLVENAVRHGIASVVEGGTIDVNANLHEGTLRISIDNPADPDRPDSRGEGIGLQNAAGRLNAVSDGRGRLHAVENEGRFHVQIELPR
ncbi:MAG TPA: histidine kinase [Thermoanaerobaculia bacterium]|nr:histidine kinase [Thermoanaerobaculia bacterium]